MERQDLSCTYLAHHELESFIIIVVIIILIIIIIIIIYDPLAARPVTYCCVTA